MKVYTQDDIPEESKKDKRFSGDVFIMYKDRNRFWPDVAYYDNLHEEWRFYGAIDEPVHFKWIYPPKILTE